MASIGYVVDVSAKVRVCLAMLTGSSYMVLPLGADLAVQMSSSPESLSAHPFSLFCMKDNACNW